MPLGHSQVQHVPSPVTLAVPDSTAPATDRVVFHGSSDDLIEVDGNVEGCDEYNSTDSHFMVIGDGLQVRIRVWYTEKGLWAISASQATEGQQILPVTIEDGTGAHSPKATVNGARLVIHEHN